jgi:hypothetical protein
VKETASNLGTPQPTVRTFGREQANLAKLYTSDLKYGGELDNFDFKLAVFRDLAQRADLPPEQWIVAYPTMLKGSALNHYYANVVRSGTVGLSFQGVCNATRNYYEGPEFRREALSRWNTITLRGTMQKSPGKATEDCLRDMVEELRRLQYSLDPDLRTDKILYNKLILACQDVPACEYACYRPAETLAGLINDLRSSILTRSKHGDLETSQFQLSETEQMFTDRRYHSNRPYRASATPTSGRPRPGKRCFVYRKEGCWSTKHTQDEQEESKR